METPNNKQDTFGIQGKRLLDFFEDFKQEISDSKLAVVSLRPKHTPTFESHFTDDFDFMIKKRDFYSILNMIYELSKNMGVNFTLNQKKDIKKRFEFFINANKSPKLVLEFWTAIEYSIYNTKKVFTAESIFNKLKGSQISKPEILSFIYITHLFHKQKNIFSDENKFRFDYFLDYLANQETLLQNQSVFELLRGIQNESIPIGRANQKAIRQLEKIGLQNKRIPKISLKRFLYKVGNKLFVLNRVIPMLGPDGVGKGSVAHNTLNSVDLKNIDFFPFKWLYRVKFLYPLRLLFLANKKNAPKNKLDERLGYYVFFTAVLILPMVLLRRRKKKLLMDRYFIDYYGRPIRYLKNHQKPGRLKFYDILLKLTPKPNQMVFLGCKDSSLIERKNELPLMSVDFLQGLNCEFIVKKKIPKVLFLSTENEIESTSPILNRYLSNTESTPVNSGLV